MKTKKKSTTKKPARASNHHPSNHLKPRKRLTSKRLNCSSVNYHLWFPHFHRVERKLNGKQVFIRSFSQCVDDIDIIFCTRNPIHKNINKKTEHWFFYVHTLLRLVVTVVSIFVCGSNTQTIFSVDWRFTTKKLFRKCSITMHQTANSWNPRGLFVKKTIRKS